MTKPNKITLKQLEMVEQAITLITDAKRLQEELVDALDTVLNCAKNVGGDTLASLKRRYIEQENTKERQNEKTK